MKDYLNITAAVTLFFMAIPFSFYIGFKFFSYIFLHPTIPVLIKFSIGTFIFAFSLANIVYFTLESIRKNR